MISKIFSILFSLFFILNLIESNPHLYRRHHSYYYRSPYQVHHVNYSPFNLPKRTYFGLDTSSAYNDLDDSNDSNEPVKGGIKNTNQNQIKTPMKLFSERKNAGFLSLSLQEKFNEAKRVNSNSIKQQINPTDMSGSLSIVPNSDLDLNEEKANIPTSESNKKKNENSAKKNLDVKGSSKTNNKSKITTTQSTTEVSTSIRPSIINEKSSIKTEINNEKNNLASNKTNQLDTKSVVSTLTTEQPTTLASLNVIENTSNSEIKANNNSSNVLKTLESLAKSEAEVLKIDEVSKQSENVPKPVEVKQSVNIVKKVETSNQESQNNVTDSIVKMNDSINPQIISDSDSKKKLENPVIIEKTSSNLPDKINSVENLSKNKLNHLVTNLKSLNPPTESTINLSVNQNNITLNNKSSVDILPILFNTESSLVENETNSPIN